MDLQTLIGKMTNEYFTCSPDHGHIDLCIYIDRGTESHNFFEFWRL